MALLHRLRFRLWMLGLLLAASVPTFGQLDSTRVAQGALIGTSEGAVTAFLGVPYALPPTGENRWKPPRPAPGWSGDRKADQFSPSCQQPLTPEGFGPWSREYVVQGEISEDCLYLNIWTSAHGIAERRPVLVWIHGGGFASGSGSVPIYDGAALASRGIVVVTINYRVGVYGFLVHPQLSLESATRSSGNYGLLDQVAALQWVRANISAFGGDPNRITIAGQSAGAASVHLLIASPLAKGLFAQAIAQSGSGMGLPIPERIAAEEAGRQLSQVNGPPLTLDQLRKLPAAELDARVARLPVTSLPALRFGPTIDGVFLPDIASVGRNTNDTPILTGMTANEVNGLNPNFDSTTARAFKDQLTSAYGAFAPRISALYPVASDREAVAQFESHARDRGLAAMYVWAKDRLAHSRYPIYGYLWTHVEPGADAHRYKAFHSSEIPYVFGTLDTSSRPFTASDRDIEQHMGQYWVNFVTSGDPNGVGLPLWPAFDVAGKQIMELGASAERRSILSADQLTVFEEYARNGGRLSLF